MRRSEAFEGFFADPTATTRAGFRWAFEGTKAGVARSESRNVGFQTIVDATWYDVRLGRRARNDYDRKLILS